MWLRCERPRVVVPSSKGQLLSVQTDGGWLKLTDLTRLFFGTGGTLNNAQLPKFSMAPAQQWSQPSARTAIGCRLRVAERGNSNCGIFQLKQIHATLRAIHSVS